MSEEYKDEVEFKGNPDGTVSFATEVLATIAGLAVNEIDGVAGMSSTSSGIADMFKSKSTRSFTKGVRVVVTDNIVSCDISVIVDYGNPIPDVARGIQENVRKAIENMSGLKVDKVDVHVTGLSFEKENRTAAELTEQQKKMLDQNKPDENKTGPDKPENADEPVIEDESDTADTSDTISADEE